MKSRNLFFIKDKALKSSKLSSSDSLPTSFKHATIYENSLYILGQEKIKDSQQENIYYKSIQFASSNWNSIPDAICLPGQTITSTPYGVLLFGGRSKSQPTNSGCLIANKKVSFLAIDITPRSDHAAAWIPSYNALLICGGRGFKDFVIASLPSGRTRTIKINASLGLYSHSIVYLHDNLVCIVGGYFENRRNTSLYIVDIASGEVESRPGLSVTVLDAFLFQRHLFVITESNPYLYNFEHDIWLELNLSHYIQDLGITIPFPGGFRVFNHSLDISKSLYIRPDFADIRGDSDLYFLNFIRNLIHINISNCKNPKETSLDSLIAECEALKLQIKNLQELCSLPQKSISSNNRDESDKSSKPIGPQEFEAFDNEEEEDIAFMSEAQNCMRTSMARRIQRTNSRREGDSDYIDASIQNAMVKLAELSLQKFNINEYEDTSKKQIERLEQEELHNILKESEKMKEQVPCSHYPGCLESAISYIKEELEKLDSMISYIPTKEMLQEKLQSLYEIMRQVIQIHNSLVDQGFKNEPQYKIYDLTQAEMNPPQ